MVLLTWRLLEWDLLLSTASPLGEGSTVNREKESEPYGFQVGLEAVRLQLNVFDL